jgi:3-hydroxyacyl-CoA dehydrogenase
MELQESINMKIKKVAVLGANGTMGSLSGGLFSQAGIRCVYFARSIEKAKRGIDSAVKQARSDVLREYIVPMTYDELEKELSDSDWILEALGEDMKLKRSYLEKVDSWRRKGSLVSTVSSSLSIDEIAAGMTENFKSHFMGTHFFNPPGKLPANELIFHPANTKELREFVISFCEKTLYRVNIIANNQPGFAGNRIGFQFINEAAQYAQQHGVEKIDYLLGPYTGRAMPPLATIDFVGLDIHSAIVDYIYKNSDDERHDTLIVPQYTKKMMDKKLYGRKGKTGSGFYSKDERDNKFVIEPDTLEYKPIESVKIDFVEKAKEYIHDGDYRKAVDVIKNENSPEAAIVRHFILSYISYSYSRIGEATPADHGIHGIDQAMAYGFSWLPPSGWVDLFGGPRETYHLIEKSGLPVPEKLESKADEDQCRIPDIQKYLIAW